MPSSRNFSIEERKWESEFFGKTWGLLTYQDIQSDRIVRDYQSVAKELDIVLKQADQHFSLLEFQASHDLFTIIPYLEIAGFRLVDSRISFKTLFNASSMSEQQFPLDFPDLRIELYNAHFLAEIISLTHKHLTNNPTFVSRFKNPLFMEPGAAEKYFTTWINNSLSSPHSVSCVLLDQQDSVKGYFIYEKKGQENDTPIYKGILTVIEEEYRGKSTHLAMQSFLFSHITESKYLVDNTTQLSNIPVIRNHVKSQRSLNSISLTFYRTNPLNQKSE